MSDIERFGYVVPISTEQLADATETRSAIQRWMSATPEQRNQWATDQQRARAHERAAADHVPLTLDGLLDKLGFSHKYAEHLVQPYCYCEDGMDGWDYCSHARDEGFLA